MIISIALFTIVTLASLIFVGFLLSSGKYNAYIEPLDKKEFKMKELYGVGFKIIEVLKLDFRDKRGNALRQEAGILFGDKYGDFYLRVLYAQKFTFCYLTVIVAGILACFADESSRLLLFGMGLLVAGALYYHFNTNISKKIKRRSVQFMGEFPCAIATIALLVNSGMMLREAWSEVAYSGNHELYKQMQRVSEDINNGIAESDALYAFALRCATPEIKKFTTFVVQGLEKGSRDLVHVLTNQTKELWEAKKQNVLQQGELAASKLLIPIMIMFIGILVMIMGPIMSNLGI
jgi:tight adherence protein C